MTELIQVATLDKTAFPRLEICRRIYSPDGLAPTIHTCGGGGTEPKILVEGGERMILKAPKAPREKIIVEPGDGIAGYFLRNGQHPYCKGLSPTIPNCRVPWVVVEVRE